MRTKTALTQLDVVPWIKKNMRTNARYETQEGQELDCQMIVRSTVERYMRRGIKQFGRLRGRSTFYETLKLEEMLQVSAGVHRRKKTKLAREGALVKDRFRVPDDDEVEFFAMLSNDDDFQRQSVQDLPTSIMTDLFTVSDLRKFFNDGKVLRGLKYLDVNWVFDVSAGFMREGEDSTFTLITAKVHHSLEQNPAVQAMLAFSGADTDLSKVSARCSCVKGKSGQCGHVIAIALCLASVFSPDEYARSTCKNRDGRNRPTIATLRDRLAQRTTKSSKTERRGSAERTKTQPDHVLSVAERVIAPPPKKRQKVWGTRT